jgi:cysteine desulfurase
VSVVGVDPEGLVNPEDVAGAIRTDTQLVSIMAANNVIGTLQPVREIGAICRARGVLFHTDAVQAAGKVPLDLQRDNIDLLSLSGHKLHGPKGVGALVVRAGLNLEPLLLGGGQERGLRSGTENVAGIVGLGAAARLALAEGGDVIARLVQLRERLIAGVLRAMPEAYLIGDRYRRLPGHACLGLAGLEGESIKVMLALDEAGIAVSTGSACSTHQAAEPSYVLRAMGFDAFRARGALRITLGRQNTEAEVERFLDILPGVVAALRPIASRLVPSMGVTQ